MDVRELIRRLRLGESVRRIARDLGVSRNTVARYARLASAEGLLEGQLPELAVLERLLGAARRRGEQECSLVEPLRERVEGLRKTGVEAQAIWRRLQEENGFTGSYSSVKRFVRRLDAQREPQTTVRLEVGPGEEAQVDFGYASELLDPRQRLHRRAWVFVMTLSHSRHQYAELVFDQSVSTWLRLHISAFEFFGGVPRRLVLDNLKAGIVHASFYDPEVQLSYGGLCEHYGVIASPCCPRVPRHKGKVESGVHYIKRNALSGRVFRDIDQANEVLLHWCLHVAGRRTHGTTHQIPVEVFEQRERPALKALPASRWELEQWKECRLHSDCHVTFDSSYYSAPHRLVGQSLMVCATDTLVKIFHQHELLALHQRADRPGQRRTNSAHLPPDKMVYLLQTPEWCRLRAAEIGPRTAELIEQLLSERPIDRLRGAQGVLRLAQKYGAQRLEAACARALCFEEIRYRTVKNILIRELDLLPLGPHEARPSQSACPRHARNWTEFFPDPEEHKDGSDGTGPSTQPDASSPASFGSP